MASAIKEYGNETSVGAGGGGTAVARGGESVYVAVRLQSSTPSPISLSNTLSSFFDDDKVQFGGGAKKAGGFGNDNGQEMG